MAVVTDPKNDRVASFYLKYGFQRLGGGRRLFMPVKRIEAWLGPKGGS